jgi:diamine N-acetyltransferase
VPRGTQVHEVYRTLDRGDAVIGLEAVRAGEEDLAFIAAAELAEENAPYVTAWPESRHREALGEAGTIYFVLRSPPDARRVGFAILRGADSPHRSIELLRLVVTEKGRGHGRTALRLIKRFVFGQLGAHRLWLDVLDNNERAQTLYRSEGFVLEGRLRECQWKDGRFETLLLMSILEHEPGARVEA